MSWEKEEVEYIITQIKRFLGLGTFVGMILLHAYVKEISIWIFAVPFSILGVKVEMIATLLDKIIGRK